jgi:Ni,Fe-hydrogenase maturation factor
MSVKDFGEMSMDLSPEAEEAIPEAIARVMELI